jgi:hypothetical protein
MLIRIWIETTQPLTGTAATSGGDPFRHLFSDSGRSEKKND